MIHSLPIGPSTGDCDAPSVLPRLCTLTEQGSAPAGSGAARVVQLVLGPAVRLWVTLEGSGVVGAAGYPLTGSAALALEV